MKKLFTLVAFLGIFAGTIMAADNFPGDPGTVVVNVELIAANMQGDSIPGYAPIGNGPHNLGDSVSIAPRAIPGYTFKTWSDDVEDSARTIVATANMSLYAFYELDEYTITFMNGDEVFTTLTANYGGAIEMPDIPSKESTDEYTYVFKGWDPEIVAVTGNAIYYAQYDSIKNKYAIRFMSDGVLMAEDSVEYGVVPQYNSDVTPTRESQQTESSTLVFTFKGWDPELTAVVGEAEYSAKFDTTIVMNKYTIMFKNQDSILEIDTVTHGEMPVYHGATPTRPMDGGTVFIFEGWEPELSLATMDMTYNAIFRDSTIQHTVLVICEKDTMYYQVIHGEESTINAMEIDGKHFVKWSDNNTEETRTIVVTEDLVLTATYADSYVDINVAAQEWTFFCLPVAPQGDGWSSDMFIYDGLEDVAWGTYNGSIRAQGQSGWESPEEYNATQGYILWSESAGRLRLNVYPENLQANDVTVALHKYEAQFPENANWNFVGNPLNRQISASAITFSDTTEASATIWNGTGYDNIPFSTASLIFTPLQAFFIQTGGDATMSIHASNSAPARNNAPAQVEENSRIDIEATAGGYTDKSRVIFRSNSSLKYEAGRDASKFMTATAPIQMYMLDIDNVKCAQMVRPAGEDAIQLGYMIRQAGDIEISSPIYADNYELYDSYADRSYDLTEGITIYSEAGTYNDRLMLRPARRVPTAIENNAAAAVTTKMLINDQLYLLRDGKLYSVQGLLVK